MEGWKSRKSGREESEGRGEEEGDQGGNGGGVRETVCSPTLPVHREHGIQRQAA